MKAIFFKNGMPVATAVLAIAGAFATTSMQNASNAFTIKAGYTLDAYGECNIAVACDDFPSPYICRLGFGGPIAYGKTSWGSCTYSLWRKTF